MEYFGRYNAKELLDRFVQVFIENGIEKTSIRMLCKSANINSNTLYQIFPNKDSIVLACAENITRQIEMEIRFGLNACKNDTYAVGELFQTTFKKHMEEVRFCIQLMSSPYHIYDQVKKQYTDMLHIWAYELAEIMGAEKQTLEAPFRLLMAVMYYYCMTGDEEGTLIQRRALYKEVMKILLLNSESEHKGVLDHEEDS